VLLVDDNVETARSLTLLLELWGHEVRVRYNGASALDEARLHPPDVVLLDIGMPGMDGYQVAHRLREQEGGGVPILIALTGYGQEEVRQRAREAGFEYHVVKPADPGELRELLVLAESLVRQMKRPEPRQG
jgi:CheY-like chemotaxis protein